MRATVRAAKTTRIQSNRAALVLVRLLDKFFCFVSFNTAMIYFCFLFQTQNAVARVKELLKNKSDCVGLRVGVKQRGCNGLTYYLEYAKEKQKLDEEVNQDGVKIFIDSKAQLTLLGTEMDFVEHKLSSEFVFHNPNVKGMCGCGESFSI